MNSPTYRVLQTDADRFPPTQADRDALQAIGAELVELPSGVNEEELAAACRDVDALLVFGTKITASSIANMNRCRIIARCGIGYDNIDIRSAVARGITLTYVPDYCVEEVSDHTIGLMLVCWRKITESNERVKNGYWDSYEEIGKLRRISSQTLGFLGYGRIAQAIARKMSAFRIRMIACDPFIDRAVAQASGVTIVSFDELIRDSDVLSLHAPLTHETVHIIGQREISRMKPGAIVIDTSRGALIDESALRNALQDGRIAAAGLDVLEQEPPDAENTLLKLRQVVITPHSAAFSEEALSELKQRAIMEIGRSFKGLEPSMPVPIPNNNTSMT